MNRGPLNAKASAVARMRVGTARAATRDPGELSIAEHRFAQASSSRSCGSRVQKNSAGVRAGRTRRTESSPACARTCRRESEADVSATAPNVYAMPA